MTTATLQLIDRRPGGEIDHLSLEFYDSPLATAVVEALDTASWEAFQVRWSGEAFCIPLGEDFLIPEDVGEIEQRHEFGQGTIAFNFDLREILIAYGDHVRFYDPDTGNRSCYIIGKVADTDLAKLEAVGKSIWLGGSRMATNA